MDTFVLLQELNQRAQLRGPDVVETSGPPRAPVETLRRGEKTLHVVHCAELCKTLLADRRVAPPPQPRTLMETAKRFGANPWPVRRLFETSPIFLHGEAHKPARRRFAAHIQGVSRLLAPELPDLAEAHFAWLAQLPDGDLARDGAMAFVDAVLTRVFALAWPGAEAHYAPLARHPQSVFDVIQHPQRLCQTLEALREFLEAQGDVGQDEAYLALGYVLMGRDPLIGSLADFLHAWVQENQGARRRWLADTTPEQVFEQSMPVNYITRVATEDLTAGDTTVCAGDLIGFLLMAAQPERTAAASAGSLAFGHGPHSCAGRVLSRQIVASYLDVMRRSADSVAWHRFTPSTPEPSVFRRYRSQ